ncbi:MAG: CAP domain-containing protein [Polyangiaceae bacterium]
MIRSRLAPGCILAAAVGSAYVAACSSSSSNPFQGDSFTDDASQGGSSNGGQSSGASSSGSSSGGGASSGASSGATSSGSQSSSGSGASSGATSSSGGSSGAKDGGSSSSSSSSSSSGGSSSGLTTDGDAGACGAPAGLTANQTTALSILNTTRAAMGSPCMTIVPSLDTSATDHCNYYAANSTSTTCDANAHVEVSGCSMYVAAQFNTRESAAGYSCQPSQTQHCMSSEVMAFDDNPTTALGQWIGSIYHRSPLLDPRMRDFGYGSATKCDTIDLGEGAGSTTPDSVIVSYPYNGQTGVPLSFQGSQEIPTPPVPPAGWPSAYPITVFMAASSITLTTDEFSIDGGAQIAHQVMTPQSANGYLSDALVLYGNVPLTSKTTYRVHVAGTRTSTATSSFDVSFAFTTQ